VIPRGLKVVKECEFETKVVQGFNAFKSSISSRVQRVQGFKEI